MIIIMILPKTVNIKQNAILSLMWCRGAGNIFGANRNRTDENTPIPAKNRKLHGSEAKYPSRQNYN